MKIIDTRDFPGMVRGDLCVCKFNSADFDTLSYKGNVSYINKIYGLSNILIPANIIIGSTFGSTPGVTEILADGAMGDSMDYCNLLFFADDNERVQYADNIINLSGSPS